MEKLLAYLNALAAEEREPFARRCGTTVAYLRTACSGGRQLSEGLAMRIAVESGHSVTTTDIRPDVDWQYMALAHVNTAQAATENVAKAVANV